MKISKKQLKRIIKEEYSKVINENHHQLPDLPSDGPQRNNWEFHFWKQMASMAKEDAEGLIQLILQKGGGGRHPMQSSEYIEARRQHDTEYQEWEEESN